MPLSERQANVLRAVDDLRRERGIAPTVREIGDRVGQRSTSTTHAALHMLKRAGVVSWDPLSPRSIVVTVQGAEVLASGAAA